MKILYIGGYGRSGSTVLASVLGAHPELVSVGELAFAGDEWISGQRMCSCGRTYGKCQFWGDLLGDSATIFEAAPHIRGMEQLKFLPALWLDRVPRRRREVYRSFSEAVFGYVEARSGKSVIVDSSKSDRLTVGRPLALTRLGGYELYFLHLVRDGRATVGSAVRRGSNWVLEGKVPRKRFPGLRASIGWSWVNLAATAVGRAVGQGRYLRIRFEDFLADPAACVQRIGAWVGVDMEPLAPRVQRRGPFDPGHMVGGNRMRFEHRIFLRGAEESASPPLSIRYSMLFSVAGGWLNHWLGYGKGARARGDEVSYDRSGAPASGRRGMRG